MTEIFYKILSFLWPIRLQSLTSTVSGKVDIFYENGKKVLNGPDTNYSFGTLETIFRHALRYFQFDPVARARILILGYGGGSLAKIFREDGYCFQLCTAVEIDPAVIKMARQHFAEYLPGINLIEANAKYYVENLSEGYHYIFVDLFEDKKVPAHFLSHSWLQQLHARLLPGGELYHNVMLKTVEERVLMARYESIFSKVQSFRKFDSNLVIQAVRKD